MSDGRSIITSDGLKPGDLIVSAGIHYIENGEIVNRCQLPARQISADYYNMNVH